MPINSSHTVLLSPLGETYVCGRNHNEQIGLGHTNLQSELIKLDCPRFISASTGEMHTIGVAYDGTVWGCGHNSFGQLGCLPQSRYTNTMTQIPDLSDIDSVAVGYFSTILLGNDGCIRVMGVIDQLTIKNPATPHIPKLVAIPAKIKQISAGNSHYLALDEQGHVHSCGNNRLGALGHGDFVSRLSPEKIPTLSGIVSVSSGIDHNLCLNISGDVYGFGNNFNGQLGIDCPKSQFIATPQKIISNIIKIICGGPFSIFCDSSRYVWVCGSNEYGQLGSNKSNPIRTPEICQEFNGMEIITGMTHTFAISSEGEIYSCGYNYYHQCGRDDYDQFRESSMESASSVADFALVPGINFRSVPKIKSAAKTST